jgi:transcriptional regulator with XRE-family HTH domain
MKKYAENARRLKLAMDEAGINQAELSSRTGIGKSSLSQYMSGEHWPNNQKTGIIADVLRVDPTWLMGFDVPMQTEDDQPVVKSAHHGWYTDPETARVAQEIFDDHDLHALFDAARNSKPEDLKMAADLLRRLKGTNPDG